VVSICLFENTTLIKHIFNYNYNEGLRILGFAVKYVQNEPNLSVLKNFSPETESHTETFLAFCIMWMVHGKYVIKNKRFFT
jgi:DNA-directed RNA polymerase specialized sigma subunit